MPVLLEFLILRLVIHFQELPWIEWDSATLGCTYKYLIHLYSRILMEWILNIIQVPTVMMCHLPPIYLVLVCHSRLSNVQLKKIQQ